MRWRSRPGGRAGYNDALTLPAGRRLGPYEVRQPLGAGGMGEVYLAHDTRLHRDVAVKVLPAAFAESAERLQRFEQEARATATLNHPNVMAVFDVGVDDGVPYVVLELLEGGTLAAALRAGRAAAARGDRPGRPDRAGPGGRAREGHRPPRPEARQHLRDRRRPRQDPRLRAGEADRGARPERDRHPPRDHAADRPRPRAGHGRLHGAGAGARRSRRPSRRHLRVRRGVLRDALGPPRLRRRFDGRADDRDPQERSARARRPAPCPRISIVSSTAASRRARRSGFNPPGTSRSPSRRCRASTSAATSAVDVGRRDAARGGGGCRSPWAPPSWEASPSARWRCDSAAPARPGVVTFEARTFDRLPITNARFMPDGRTIVYSATPSGSPPELLRPQPDRRSPAAARAVERAPAVGLEQRRAGRHRGAAVPRSAPLRRHAGPHDHRQLAARHRGRRARGRLVAGRVHDGDRARPRQRARSARVSRPARALHEASGYLSNPRVSPDGSRVAFVEHQQPLRRSRLGQGRRPGRQGDDADRRAVRRAGPGVDGRRVDHPVLRQHRRVVDAAADGGTGVGRRAAAAGLRRARAVHRLRRRQRRAMAGGARGSVGRGARARAGPGRRARPVVDRIDRRAGAVRGRRLAADGRRRASAAAPTTASSCARRTRSQTIRLGEGLRAEALARRQVGRRDHRLAGAARALSHRARRRGSRSASPRSRASSRPDGSRTGNDCSCAARSRRAPPAATASTARARRRRRSRPRASWPRWRPTAGRCCSRCPTARSQLSSIDGGPTRPVHGLRSGDRQIAWSRDGRSVYVQRGFQAPADVERVALATGDARRRAAAGAGRRVVRSPRST